MVAGLLLWVMVFAAAMFLIQEKKRARPPGPDLAEASVQEPAQPITEDGKGLDSFSAWSKSGIEDFVFTERSGRKVTKADLLGHPWLISFIFTRCAGPCPRVSAQMSELQRWLDGSDVRLVTLSVDPDFDTTAVLKRYADSYRADPNRWLYLTGDKRKTYELIKKSFLLPVMEYTGKDREPGYEVLHSTKILLVNEKGIVVKGYNALDDVEMALLRHDLEPYVKRSRPSVGNGQPHSEAMAKGSKR
jgi:protein SCO1